MRQHETLRDMDAIGLYNTALDTDTIGDIIDPMRLYETA